MIVHGNEEIFCYDAEHAKIKDVKDFSQIVIMNDDMKTASNCSGFIRKVFDDKIFDKFKVPFLRNDNIFISKFGGNPWFPTNRGMTPLDKIGKNNLVYMYDGTLALCKTRIQYDSDNSEWYQICSKQSGLFVIINGVFVEI